MKTTIVNIWEERVYHVPVSHEEGRTEEEIKAMAEELFVNSADPVDEFVSTVEGRSADIPEQ